MKKKIRGGNRKEEMHICDLAGPKPSRRSRYVAAVVRGK